MTANKNVQREKLAEYAHEAWSEWMKYIFSKCFDDIGQLNKSNGILILSADLVRRWTRQMNTPYNELSEDEKESDREEADKIISIFKGEKKCSVCELIGRHEKWCSAGY